MLVLFPPRCDDRPTRQAGHGSSRRPREDVSTLGVLMQLARQRKSVMAVPVDARAELTVESSQVARLRLAVDRDGREGIDYFTMAVFGGQVALVME